MQLDWAIYTSLIEKSVSRSYHSKHLVFLRFFMTQDYVIIVLVLQLIWYYSTSWVSNIGDLVWVLFFWFRIVKCWWFCMPGTIAYNFLKIWNGWTIVEKYATSVVYIGAHFFPQLLENSRSHSNA